MEKAGQVTVKKGLQPEVSPKKGKKKRKKNKNKQLTESHENASGILALGSENKPKKKPEKEKAKSNILTTNDMTSFFSVDEFTKNQKASSLISDLVMCFTNNCALPLHEKEKLNTALCQKTVSVFILILNSCVEKIFNKMLSAGFVKSLLVKNQIYKKDASCQTDISCSYLFK